MTDRRFRKKLPIAAGLLLLAGGGTGCGAIAVEGGIFPLPTIHLIWPLPEQLGMTAESVVLETPNGGPIYGWFIPAASPRATVIIHHGALINRSATSDHYQLLNRHQFNVFVYDYQGFGESLVVAQLSTVLSDADAALAYVQQHDGPGSEKIIIFGQSMGTLPAIAQAARSPGQFRVVGGDAAPVGVHAAGHCAGSARLRSNPRRTGLAHEHTRCDDAEALHPVPQ